MNSLAINQKVPIRILKSALRTKRIAHAYLLKGPRGSGKAALAEEFAKGLLCLGANGQETGANGMFSCGLCESCSQMTKGSHPDLFEIEKDGANIKIKASYGMLKEVLTRPVISNRKVFVINEAEALTAEAANALLKLLEEPPSYVTFILTTRNESAIPATVVSRCQVISLKALPEAAIAEDLENVYGVPQNLSADLSALSDGSYSKALEILAQSKEKTINLETLIKRIAEDSPLDLAVEYSKVNSKERLRVLNALELEVSQRLWGAALRYDEVRSEDHGAKGKLILHRIFKVLKSVMRAKKQLGSNTNSLLVFSTLFMDIHGFIGEI